MSEGNVLKDILNLDFDGNEEKFDWEKEEKIISDKIKEADQSETNDNPESGQEDKVDEQ